MPNYLHLILESERLQLVPFSLEYANALCKEFTAELTQHMWPSAPKTQQEINQHIAAQRNKMQTGRDIDLIITNKTNQEFLGQACIHQATSFTPELGIWIKKGAQGNGFGFEAMDLLKKWADTNLEFFYMKYSVVKVNLPSRKIAEKMGGIIADEYIKASEAGKLLDEVEYRLYKPMPSSTKALEKMDITIELVQNLIKTQFPQWSQLSIQPVENGGWDNKTFHLGEDMLIRMPSAAAYVLQAEKEQRWLPVLAQELPLPIPAPIALGKPDVSFPWRWSINRWLSGEAAQTVAITDLTSFAKDLANFLKALQHIDTKNGPLAGPHSFYRGGDLLVYDAETRNALTVLKDKIDAKAATKVWEGALSTSWKTPPVWVHGDVSLGNLLLSQGRLSAVIDFGQLAIGDPACDLAIAWTFFEGHSRSVFLETLGLDQDTLLRGRAWALWKALLYLVNAQPGMNFESKRAERTIQEVILSPK